MSATAETRAAERNPSGVRRGYERLVATIDAAPIAVRVLAAIGVLALLVAAAFVVVLLAMSSLRASTDEQVRVNRVTAATLRLQGVVDELDQSFQGFVLTRNRRIRESWNRASRELGPAKASLEKAVAEQPGQVVLGRNVVDLIDSYVTDYGEPLIAIALESPTAARSPAASQEGLTRIGQIRRNLAALLAREDRIASQHAAHARKRSNQAVLIGIVALSASCVVLLLVLGYLIRSVAHPVRDVASGAAQIAAGDFSIRIPPDGPAEIQELTTAFNSMAGSVEAGRRNLERQNEQLRESERAKSELITIVSHELRNPLASILGYTSLILRRDMSRDAVRRYVEIIHEQGQRLVGLVEGFLSAEEVGGRMELESEPVDLASMLKREVRLAADGTPDHKLVVDVPEDGLEVIGDEHRLEQVVVNLVANAVKYSPEGGTVSVSAAAGNGAVRISVRDTGPGIPRDQQARIFEKFGRAEVEGGSKPGTGLGLFIARSIAETHGGSLEVTSGVEPGSTFTLTLPVAR